MNQRVRLGKQIVQLREKLGSVTRPLSRDDLAAMITDRLKRKPPMAGSTIMKWERGEGGSPDPWALVELARLAGVTVEEFVYPRRAVRTGGVPDEAEPEEVMLRDKPDAKSVGRKRSS